MGTSTSLATSQAIHAPTLWPAIASCGVSPLSPSSRGQASRLARRADTSSTFASTCCRKSSGSSGAGMVGSFPTCEVHSTACVSGNRE